MTILQWGDMSTMVPQIAGISTDWSTTCSKKISKHHITGPSWEECTGDQWVGLLKGQQYGKCFYDMTCHEGAATLMWCVLNRCSLCLPINGGAVPQSVSDNRMYRPVWRQTYAFNIAQCSLIRHYVIHRSTVPDAASLGVLSQYVSYEGAGRSN